MTPNFIVEVEIFCYAFHYFIASGFSASREYKASMKLLYRNNRLGKLVGTLCGWYGRSCYWCGLRLAAKISTPLDPIPAFVFSRDWDIHSAGQCFRQIVFEVDIFSQENNHEIKMYRINKLTFAKAFCQSLNSITCSKSFSWAYSNTYVIDMVPILNINNRYTSRVLSVFELRVSRV